MQSKRAWLLILGALLALGAGGAYFWKKLQQPEPDELLLFTSLYVACPLALSLLSMFAYFQGQRRR